MRRYLKSFSAASRLPNGDGDEHNGSIFGWSVGRCGSTMVNDAACSHGTFCAFPSLLSSFSRNNVDSAATTVVIKIGCFPVRRTNSPEQGRDLLPLLFLRSPLVFIWEGCNGGTRRSYEEQDRKNSGLERGEYGCFSLLSYAWNGRSVGGITSPVVSALPPPHDRGRGRRMNVARNFCRTIVVAARQYVCHHCR